MERLEGEGAQVEPRIVAEITSHVFDQLGRLTRELHDALGELGLISRLQQAANGLPDARSRLDYISRKTGEAADKVLNCVDRAKLEHERLAGSARELSKAILADPVRAVASGAVLGFANEVQEASARVDRHLTEIMIAQDFHDLTGQVVSKVVSLATELEESLVRLLVQVTPPGTSGAQAPGQAASEPLSGPVVDPKRAADVVSSQNEVDDLLANLGF